MQTADLRRGRQAEIPQETGMPVRWLVTTEDPEIPRLEMTEESDRERADRLQDGGIVRLRDRIVFLPVEGTGTEVLTVTAMARDVILADR